MMTEKILIIRLGALGDILLCMKLFQDIRASHPNAHITFMTTPPFAGFARTMPWFDAVITDTRPAFYQLDQWLELAWKMKRGGFTLVFDLQNKPRTNLYYRLFFRGKGMKWSGTAKGCAYPRPPVTQKMHRQQEMIMQARAAGVADSGPLNLDWMQAPITHLSLPQDYAVLVPGCSPHLPHKRWPPAHYAALAQKLKEQGLGVVIVGTQADAEAIAAIKAEAGFVIDLAGRTSLHELASLYRSAHVVIGNDTGPVFLSAMTGAPTLTLMSFHTDPVLSGPVGPRCVFLKKEQIAEIGVNEVVGALQKLNA